MGVINMRKIKAKMQSLLYREGVTPLPAKIMLTIYFLNFSSSMVLTMVFSFIPKLVKSFGATEVNTGYYAGFIGSALFLSRVVFSVFWGYMSDRKGAKVTLLASAVGTMLSTLAFGFSSTFYWALVTRFIQGVFMGVIVVSKAIIAKISDETNISVALSLLISSYSVGLIIGPSIAGYLSFPAEKYPETFARDGLFGRYPILLPSLFIVTAFVISIMLAIIYLTDDNERKNEVGSILSTPLARGSYCSSVMKHDDNTENDGYWDISLEHGVEEEINQRIRSVSILLIIPDRNEGPESSTVSSFSLYAFKQSKLYRVITKKEAMLCCLLYGLFGFAWVANTEMFPLFAATAAKFNGLGFSTVDIGNALLFASIVVTIAQLTVMARFNDYFGARKTLIIVSLALDFLFPLLPSIAPIHNKYLLRLFVYTILFLQNMFFATGFLAINVLLNNSVDTSLQGSANGLAMTCTSLGRLSAPTIFGSLFSWSLTNIRDLEHAQSDHPLGFPFNQFFAFLLQSLWIIFIAVLASQLPASMNRERNTNAQIDVVGEGNEKNITKHLY